MVTIHMTKDDKIMKMQEIATAPAMVLAPYGPKGNMHICVFCHTLAILDVPITWQPLL